MIISLEKYSKCHIHKEIDSADKKSINGMEVKKYSYEDFKDHMNSICHTAFKIFYVSYGIFQFFAIWAGFVNVFHHDNIIMLLASLVLGFLPFIGTVFGIYGAQIAWGWDIPYSMFIFIAPYFIANGPLLLIGFFDIYKDCKRWEEEAKNM